MILIWQYGRDNIFSKKKKDLENTKFIFCFIIVVDRLMIRYKLSIVYFDININILRSREISVPFYD